MTEARKRALAEIRSSGKKLDRHSLTASEIREVIDETALRPTDREIAIRRYCQCLKPGEIAALMSYDERTIRRRIAVISARLCLTLMRMVSS